MEIITLSGYTELEKLQIAKRISSKSNASTTGARLPSPDQRSGAASDHQRLHPRGRRAQLRARDRDGLPQSSAQDRRESALQSARKIGESRGLSEQAALLQRSRESASPRSASPPEWPIRPSAATFCSSRRRDAGTGKLVLTGELGEVMKESAQAAVSFLRSRSSELGLPEEYFSKHDIHIHVPAGATPKDGPSAGIALATSSLRCYRHQGGPEPRNDRRDHADGGKSCRSAALKEKVLGAKRAGISKICSHAQRDGSRRHPQGSARHDDVRAGRRALRSLPSRSRQAASSRRCRSARSRARTSCRFAGATASSSGARCESRR